MQPHQFKELLEKYASGACTPAEEQLVHDWYERVNDPEDNGLNAAKPADVQERIWAAINPEKEEVVGRNRSWLMKAAIIAFPVMIGVGWYLNRQPIIPLTAPAGPEYSEATTPEKHIINSGELALTVPLSDGSQVTLQPSSEIFISRKFGTRDRKVRLKGEAFFNVRPDVEKPFFVYANGLVTRVLGTSFNVRAYDDDQQVTVAVRTGKVSVYRSNHKRSLPSNHSPQEELILTPNQQVIYHREEEKVTRKLVEKPEIILPKSALFRMQFENADVSKIFEVLEKNYGIEIRYDREDLAHCKLTTSMSDEGLYERIEVICRAIGASYVIGDSIITITSDGC